MGNPEQPLLVEPRVFLVQDHAQDLPAARHEALELLNPLLEPANALYRRFTMRGA